MIEPLPTGTNELRPSPVYCLVCNHSAPIECSGCGGGTGSNGFAPCKYCRPQPATTSTPPAVTYPAPIRDAVNGEFLIGDDGEVSGQITAEE